MTQRAKLAPPANPAERGDHPNAVCLVEKDGSLTPFALSLTLGGEKLSDAQMDAIKDQALRQEVYGIRPSKN